MTAEAWIMLAVTWAITIGCTVRFLFTAVTRPVDEEKDDP